MRLIGRGPLRLLMTADAVGGVWQYATRPRRRARRPRRRDDACRARPGALGASALAGGGDPADPHRRSPACRSTGPPASPGEVAEASRAVAALARSVGADIVHLNSPALAADARFPAPVVGVCHSCLATWWRAVRSGPLPQDFVWRTALLASWLSRRRGARRADRGLRADDRRRLRHSAAARGAQRPAPGAPHEPAEPASFVFTAGRLWDEGKNLAALDRAAARLDVPVLAAGPLAGPNGAMIALPHLAGARRARRRRHPGVARAPSDLRVACRATSPSALPCSKPPRPAARSCFRISRRCASSGTARRCSCRPMTTRPSPRRSRDLVADPRRRARLGGAARARSETYTVESTAQGMMAIYEAVLARQAALRHEAAA